MHKNSKRFVNYGVAFARAQYPLILGKLKDRRRAYFYLKEALDYPDLCEAADFIEKNVSHKLQDLIFGNPLPSNYKELGQCSVSYVSKNLISEINWTLISIRKYAYQINLFLAYKDIYESHLILGNYSESEKYLKKIEDEICCSLWSLENRFLLKELTTSGSDNKEFLSEFNHNNESEGVTKSLAHFLSLKAERTLSVTRYNSDLKAALSKLDGESKEANIDYYLFKLSFINHLKFTKHIEILAYDFPHSIIDKYLNLRNVFANLLTSPNETILKVENKKLIKDYLSNRITYLIRKVDDPILFKLKLLCKEKIFSAFNDADSINEIAVIDMYTTGLYQEAEDELKTMLLTSPVQFDLYELYVKSLVYQKKQFQEVGNYNSLQNQILREMYRVVSVSVNPSESAINLLRIANNLSNSVLSYGIIDFVLYQAKGKSERKLLSKLSYNAANPIMYEIYNSQDQQLAYLNLLKDRFPNSITVEFLLKKIDDIDKLFDFEKLLPEVKFKTEYAKGLQKKGAFEDAASVWEVIIEKYFETTPILETAIRNLFICYEELKRYDDCITLFVDSFFANAFIIEKIEVQSLLDKIKQNRFKVVKPNIELPIFYTISNADENETHTAFEKFNLSIGVCKPSELLPRYSEFENHKILFYLKFTCGPEILKHSIHIIGSKDRLEERLSICQFLREKDKDDKAFYDDEIKYISNILVIQKGLLELDESKIYVNEQGIIATELKDYEAIYQRFKTIASIADKSKVLFLDKKGRLTTVNYTEEKIETDKIEYSLNPVFDIYKELFDVIKDNFLHSKFGIVAYLSTRIRHGVLLGEIRPIFEKHKLITLREGDNTNYRRNSHWDNVFSSEDLITLAKLQELLKEFSISVDGLIFDLIKRYLQVYDSETNKDGWFDYDFDDESLFWYSIASIKTRDFNQFVQKVFEILWDRTDKNLSIIRKRIQDDIANDFNSLFEKLEKDIHSLLGSFRGQTLISSIKACSTETQTVIKRISSWFKRSGTSASDFHINNLIDIVMEYTNKTHPNKKIKLTRVINDDCKIKGEYLTHFADLIRIFTENILKHSDEKTDLIDAKIIIDRIDDVLEIKIENTVTNKQSVESLKSLWVNKKIDISKLLNEGKSGYHKAYKILQSDLLNEDNYMFTALNDSEDLFCVTMIINLNNLTT